MAKKPLIKITKLGVPFVLFCFVFPPFFIVFFLGVVGASSEHTSAGKSHAPESSAALAMVMTMA
jgi:hypothetical protein